MAASLHIAIKPETLFEVGGIGFYNTLTTSFLVTLLILAFALWANRQLKSINKPSKAQAFVEMLVESIYGIVASVAGKRAWAFMPLIFAYFVFITLNNWVEQIPGFHTIVFTGKPEVRLVQVPSWMQIPQAYATAVEESTHETVSEVGQEADLVSEHAEESAETGHASEGEHKKGVALLRGANADLNMTLALALISVGATQFYGLKFAKLGYLKKFFNFSGPIPFFIGILELLSEFSRILSFSFRLFGNIFAGEVLIAVISFLVPVLVPTPFMAFELFVGALQAYVFAMISTVTYSMAAEHHDH